jgi:hypothetical protein
MAAMIRIAPPGQGHPAQHRVKDEDRGQEDGRPRHVEKREDDRRGKQAATASISCNAPSLSGRRRADRSTTARKTGAFSILKPRAHPRDDAPARVFDEPVEQ